MNSKHENNRHAFLPLALLGLIGGLALPSIGNATPIVIDEPTPIAVDKDDCEEKSVVSLTLDVSTGDLYMLDDTGTPTLVTNNEIDVYVGTLSMLVVDLAYTSDEWIVDVVPLGGTAMSYYTSDGELSYWADTSVDEYEFISNEISGMSTMMNMHPILPDIVIRPRRLCPPPI